VTGRDRVKRSTFLICLAFLTFVLPAGFAYSENSIELRIWLENQPKIHSLLEALSTDLRNNAGDSARRRAANAIAETDHIGDTPSVTAALHYYLLEKVFSKVGLSDSAAAARERNRALADRQAAKSSDDASPPLGVTAEHYSKSGRYRQAAELGKYALSLEIDAGRRFSDGAIWLTVNLARDLRRTGNLSESLDIVVRSLEAIKKEKSQDDLGVLALLNEQASALRRLGRSEEALKISVYLSAAMEKIHGPDDSNTIVSNINLAVYQAAVGDFASAALITENALAASKRTLGSDAAPTRLALRNLSGYYASLGDYRSALRLANESYQIEQGLNGETHRLTLGAINRLGASHALNKNYEQALHYALKYLAGVQVVSEFPDYMRIIANAHLSNIYNRMGKAQDADRHFRQGLEIGNRKPEELKAYISLLLFNQARTLKFRGDYAGAIDLAKKALAIHLEAGMRRDPALAARLGLVGSLYKKSGRSDLAIFFLNQAVEIYESIRDHVLTLRPDNYGTYTDQVAWIYKELAYALTDEGRLGEASNVLMLLKAKEFSIFTRGKGNLPRHERVSRHSSVEIAWAERLKDIANEFDVIHEQINTIKSLSPNVRSSHERSRLNELEDRLEAIKATIRMYFEELEQAGTNLPLYPQLDRARLAADSLENFRRIFDELDSSVALLQIYTTDDRLNFLLSSRDWSASKSIQVESTEIQRQIFDFYQKLKSPESDILGASKALYSRLFQPVSSDLERHGVRVLLLSLNGVLRYVPFASLHDGESYLVEKYKMPVYVSVGRDRLSRSNQRRNWRVAAFGLTKPVLGFPALPNVRQELLEIVKNPKGGAFPGEIYLDDQFTRTSMAAATQQEYTVMHLASHFRFSPGSEINSFLALGDGRKLTLQDFRSSDFKFSNFDFLVLSACETGLGGGVTRDGKEVEGLGVIAQERGRPPSSRLCGASMTRPLPDSWRKCTGHFVLGQWIRLPPCNRSRYFKVVTKELPIPISGRRMF
jgi:CHAT domain-containing protein